MRTRLSERTSTQKKSGNQRWNFILKIGFLMRNSLFNQTWKSSPRQCFIHEERFIFGVSVQIVTILIGNVTSQWLESKQKIREICSFAIQMWTVSSSIEIVCFLLVAWRSRILTRFGSLSSHDHPEFYRLATQRRYPRINN